MDYISIQEAAAEWNISRRRIQVLCREGRVQGARMVGNMWLIPKDTGKPYDARRITPVLQEEKKQFSVLRKELKMLLKNLYSRLNAMGFKADIQRNKVLSALAAALVKDCLKTHETEDIKKYYNIIYKEISGKTDESDTGSELFKETEDFVIKFQEDPEIDNIISWAYQYSNKLQNSNVYQSTQFFTEKYMINYLVRNIEKIALSKKIVDPCCGGGNFLTECLEFLCCSGDAGSYSECVLKNAQKLYGYDIDADIARVAVVNIKLKAFSLMKRGGGCADFSIWHKIMPHIYLSSGKKTGGSLAFEKEDRWVYDILTEEKILLKQAINDADIVLTNPPFETVKKMDDKLKAFLRDNYPMSKCDTCAAFLLAIPGMLKDGGMCGIVTQSAWMHLKSFSQVREYLLEQFGLQQIANLGSGAFYDLSGEKSNVSLMVMCKGESRKAKVLVTDLTVKSLIEKARTLEDKEEAYVQFDQDDLRDSRNGFDFISSGGLKELAERAQTYIDIAAPMQGTSTGNAKKLVGYFWKHFNDKEWKLVSSGGGYCRWEGLNSCVVKWGKEGEYIRNEKGSALRNVKYFKETKMVFSDTGTAGLNVRILLEGQIFIASGPGIRVKTGNPYAHMAFLNSRLATYYIRILSPKLTIAAGYIGKLPITGGIYDSVILEKNAKLCIELKQKYLMLRPSNIEYQDQYLRKLKGNLDQCAFEMFTYDMKNELLKLEIESQSDTYITDIFGLTKEECCRLDEQVGKCAYNISRTADIAVEKLDCYFDKLLDSACMLRKTRVSKLSIGNDGLLEYAAKELNINPEYLVKIILSHEKQFCKVTGKYRNLILHNEVLKLMGYHTEKGLSCQELSMEAAASYMAGKYQIPFDIKTWLTEEFIRIHRAVFKNEPILETGIQSIRERGCR